MSDLTGRAQVITNIRDESIIRNTGIKGVIALIGPTERGPHGDPQLVGSWLSYRRIFGGLLDDSNFPLYCRRALEAGAKILVCRLGHYTDASDAGTLVGVKATVTDGSDPNDITFTAKSIGAWGNSLTVNIVAASSGKADAIDIQVDLAGYPELSYTIFDIDDTLTQADVDAFNANSPLVDITGFGASTIAPASNLSLATGAEDITTVVALDYIGDSAAQTGIHSFSNNVEPVKIAAPDISDDTVDTALISYADTRKDLIAVIRTPLGLNSDGIVDYRNGTGAYSHDAFDSWRGIAITGGLKINHPETGLEMNISAIADVLGAMSRRDNQFFEWFTFGGPERGKISNALGVVYNLGSPALTTEADLVDVAGVNAVIVHPKFGIVVWGNSTLLRQNTMLKHSNVAELLIYLTRELNPLVESELFNPNDIETWKNIYRKVKPLMDKLVNERALWRYKYQGDQDIDDIADAQVNDPVDVDSGIYRFNLFIAPKVGAKYIEINAIVSNSGVDFESLTV